MTLVVLSKPSIKVRNWPTRRRDASCDSSLRWGATLSISSKKIIARSLVRASSKIDLMISSLWPTYLLMISGPLIL